MVELSIKQRTIAPSPRATEGSLHFRAMMGVACILIVLMPIASGARGFSEALGRGLLAACDAALIALFLIAIPYARARLLSAVVIAIILISAAYMTLGDPFPPFTTSYQGLRKSLLWIVAIVVGSALPRSAITPICNVMLAVLILICLYGIKQFFIQSTFDSQLLAAQSASLYANKIGQYTRATSVLSSGFHLGMAGCLLICLIVYARGFSLLARFSLVGIALFAIYASFTRTFLIVAFAVLVLRVVSHSRARLSSAILITMLTVTALVYSGLNIFGRAFSAFADDDRFIGRAESYVEFSRYMAMNPGAWLTGFGPGTAGSTLGDQYRSHGTPWIEPHNIFTKYVFEFGLPITIAVYGSILLLAITARKQKSRFSATSARMAIFVILVSGLTITSVETWPINIYIGLLLGMLCSPWLSPVIALPPGRQV